MVRIGTKTNSLVLVGLIIISLLMISLYIGPIFLNNDPLQIDLSNTLQEPTKEFPLGTDNMGRCVLSRILYGGQMTLETTFIVIALILIFGITLGVFAGYLGGKIDAVFMRIVDGLIALPDIILAIFISGLLGPSLLNVTLAIVIVKSGTYIRLVRGIVLQEKVKDYVQSAIVCGTNTRQIIIKHLIPSTISQVLTLATLDIGKIILIIASLSYIGLGAQPPLPEWGVMLNEGRSYFLSQPSLMIYPGLSILSVVLGFNLLGDGLRDTNDVKQRGY